MRMIMIIICIFKHCKSYLLDLDYFDEIQHVSYQPTYSFGQPKYCFSG